MPNDLDKRDLHAQWEIWCREAAAKDGITVEELKRRLDAGEALLEISATIKPVHSERESIGVGHVVINEDGMADLGTCSRTARGAMARWLIMQCGVSINVASFDSEVEKVFREHAEKRFAKLIAVKLVPC